MVPPQKPQGHLSESQAVFQSLPLEENKKKREKENSNQRVGESKKERKFSIKDRKKTEEICRKVFGPDNI